MQCTPVLNSERNKNIRLDDSETYVSQTGSSTTDYFIVSNDLCRQELLESLVVDSSCVESDHLPVSLILKLSPRAPKMKHETEEVRWVEKTCLEQRQSTRVS